VAVGVLAGVPSAAAAVQVTRSLVGGLPSLSTYTIVLPALVLGAAALVAMLLPAQRAAAIDPLVVLKE
jgi:ABC-type antimicrobial peptide transport system permease subunit